MTGTLLMCQTVHVVLYVQQHMALLDGGISAEVTENQETRARTGEGQ